MTRYVGLDLAWSDRGPAPRTGVAVLDERGRLVASSAVRTDDDVAAAVRTHAPGDVVVAIDAPLVVRNPTGRRECERLVGLEFARAHAGAHPSNLSRPWFDPPRGARLAERLGWEIDPAAAPGGGRSVAIEVYPHPAMVVLFGLERVLPYKAKPGRDLETLRAAFALLLDHLERVVGPTLGLADHPRWAALRAVVPAARRKADLRRIEDELDAILCAYLAWRWGTAREGMRVLGTAEDGYIVLPRAGGTAVGGPR